MSRKPNIILFNPDQWRGDVMGHMGNEAAVTPYLDDFASTDAVSFRNAFCQNPVCTPSRCSFMSGWYPHVRGHRTMYHMMQPDEPVLLKKLKDEGYFVWWGGKNDLVPADKGLDAYCDVKHMPENTAKSVFVRDWDRGEPGGDAYYSFYYGALEVPEQEEHALDSDWSHVRAAIDFIKHAPDDQPFCIYLPLLYPHPPYAAERHWIDRIDRSRLPERIRTLAPGKPSILHGLKDIMNMDEWTEERWDELRAVYYGMCARVDHQFGLVRQALKDAGVYDDTAVFFFSDHGDFTGDYGLVEKTQNTFEDCLVRVPFIVKPPASSPVRPGVRDGLVELVDLAATVLDYTGLTADYTHFGQSLEPLIAGRKDTHRDAVFSEGGRLKGEAHCNESTPFNEDPPSLYWPRGEMQRSEGPEHTKAVMVRTERYKYVRRLYETDELYDLEADPGETVNRIADESYRETLLALKERLLQFYQETSDVVPFERNRRELSL